VALVSDGLAFSESHGEFRGIVAETYDSWMKAGRESAEYDLYRRHIVDNRGPALEIGCGTGRLLLALREDGLDVDGVDYSPDMLRECRRKAARQGLAVQLFEQSMEALDLPRRYHTLFVPSNTFMLLTGRDEARKALHRFYAHLEREGELLLSLAIPWAYIRNAADGEWRELARAEQADGSTIVLSERVELDLWEQLKTNVNMYEVFDKQGNCVKTHKDTICVRWYGKHEIELMLAEAGFHCISLLGGEAGGSSSMIVCARKLAAGGA
jgi:SAM-dependent methyltransferase